MPSRLIHVIASGKISFILTTKYFIIISITFHIHKYIHTCHIFVHSFVDRHSGHFHISAVVNNAALSMGIQVSLFEILISYPLAIYPELGFLDHMVFLSLIVWGAFILFSIMTGSIYFLSNIQHFKGNHLCLCPTKMKV